MLETMEKRMQEVGVRVVQSDAETLWVEVIKLAQEHDYPFANAILQRSKFEHWTVQRTALALAYAHMVLSNEHWKDVKEVMDYSIRPIIITGNNGTNNIITGNNGADIQS